MRDEHEEDFDLDEHDIAAVGAPSSFEPDYDNPDDEDFVDDGTGDLDGSNVVIPVERLRRLMELREKRDSSKVAADQAEKEYRAAEADLYELLDSGPVKRLSNVDLGEPWGKVSFGARSTDYGKVIKGMDDEALEFFRRTGEFEAMTEKKLKKKRLNELVRQYLEEGKPLPPGIDFYTNRGVTITRQKD